LLLNTPFQSAGQSTGRIGPRAFPHPNLNSILNSTLKPMTEPPATTPKSREEAAALTDTKSDRFVQDQDTGPCDEHSDSYPHLYNSRWKSNTTKNIRFRRASTENHSGSCWL
jgi:hypothetical protein